MQKKFIILIFSIIATSCHFPLPAQLPDYHVRVFDERNGIHSYLMRKIVKDQYDFIWILYPFKIQQFDGRQVIEFSFEDPLNSIICDQQNNIWVSSNSRIYRFSVKEKKFERITYDTTDRQLITGLLNIPGLPAVIHTTHGFYHFDSTKKTFTKIDSGPLSFSMAGKGESADIYGNRVFVLGNDTLHSIDLKSGNIIKLGVAALVQGIYPLHEEKVLVSYWTNQCSWFDFTDNSVTNIDIGKDLTGASSYFIRAFDADRLNREEYIITSNHGPLLYNSVTNQFRRLELFTEGRPFRNKESITDIFIDKEKKVWAASGYGLIFLNAGEGQIGLIRNYENDEKKAFDNNVRGFAADEKGNLWMATLNGFAYYDLKNGKIMAYHPNVNDTNTYSFPSVRGIAYDGKYVILGPTDRGVWLYDIKTKSFRQPVFLNSFSGKKLQEKLNKDFIDHILKLKSGDYIISGRDGYYFMRGKDFVISPVSFPGETENGNFSYQDNSGDIWLGTAKGLYCFDSSMNFLFHVKENIGTNARCMLELERGKYLIGSVGGLYLLKRTKDKVAEATFVDSHFDKLIVNIVFQDKMKKIWLATNEGLMRYDMNTRKIEKFDFFDNIQTNTFNDRAYHLTLNGILFLGGYNGINYMEPEKVQNRDDNLKLTITRLVINEVESHFYGNQNLKLRHFQNSIELEFSAPYFTNPNQVRYRYWLKGLDQKWVDNGNNNSIRFSALAPGAYEFKVAASIDHEQWFESERSFSFIIRPPFWITWWFRTLVVLLVAVSVYALYRYQLNKRLEVERFRHRISRDLHDDIGSTLSSINILARSSLGKKTIEEEANTLLLQKIQQRSQKTLDAMDDLIWNTKPENDSLESLVVRMREFANEVLEPAGIHFTLNCPATLNHVKLNMQQKRNLYLIFKEAVNNLAKYSNSKSAIISFEYQRKLLQMIITDEGSGFTLTSIKKGNGLDNMQSRAAEMNAQLEIKSGKGQGTLICVHLPV